MAGWLLRVALADAAAVARLRLRADVDVCATDDALWVRGPDDGADAPWLRAVPGERFVATDGRAVPVGRLLPTHTPPAGGWQPIATWLTVDAPPTALPGVLRDRVPLRIVPSPAVQDAGLLVTTLAIWVAFADDAPALRLRHLAFAASGLRVAIRRTHADAILPAIPATRYTLVAGVAVPFGYALAPALPGVVIARRLGLGVNDVALFAPDASYERIPAEAFVSAQRSAIRRTAQRAAPPALGPAQEGAAGHD